MILHPGILALLLGSSLSLALLFFATFVGIKIVLYWDPASSSEEQLILQQKTYLVSTLVGLVLWFSIFSGLLFLYTIDDIHPLFVGAMCATGTLNANPVGWSVLLIKGLLFFTASIWVIFNSIDQSCEDTPLVRLKYAALPVLALLLAGDLVLQFRFFSGLHPERITSCCGSLFATGSGTVAGELAAMPPATTMKVLYTAACLWLFTVFFCLGNRAGWLRLLLFLESLLLLPLSLISVISFISLYVYQMPSHHCPFDMVQKNYSFVGYPLYIGLFVGILFGVVPGIGLFLRKYAGLEREIEKRERKWLILALVFFSLFLFLATWPILFGKFHL